MAEEIKIKKKSVRRGDDGHKVVSVRMKDELIERLDALAKTANRSPQRDYQFASGISGRHC